MQQICRICINYASILQKVCNKYASNLQRICNKHANYAFPKHATNMIMHFDLQKIYNMYAQICKKYEQICKACGNESGFKNMQKYATNIQNMQNMQLTICIRKKFKICTPHFAECRC